MEITRDKPTPAWMFPLQIIHFILFMGGCIYLLPAMLGGILHSALALALVFSVYYFLFFTCVWYQMEYWVVPHDERPGVIRYFAEESRSTILATLWFYIIVGLFVNNIIRKDDSMETALKKGDTLLYSSLPYVVEPPARGDIVRLDLPDGISSIRRVIGLPGETVSIKEGYVVINGIWLDEPYVKSRDESLTIPPRQLAPDEYVVLPDVRPTVDNEGMITLRKYISAKVFMRVAPLSRFGVLPSIRYSSTPISTNRNTGLPIARRPLLSSLPTSTTITQTLLPELST